jgi:hypothetical protein
MVATFLVLAGAATAQTATPTPIDCSTYDDRIAALDAEYENISQAEAEAVSEWLAEREAMYALDPEDRPKTIAEVDQEYFPGKWERLDRQNQINDERLALSDAKFRCLSGSQAQAGTSGAPIVPAEPATSAPSTPSGSDIVPSTGGLTEQETPSQSGTPAAPGVTPVASTPAGGGAGSDGSANASGNNAPPGTPVALPGGSPAQAAKPVVEQPLSATEAGAAGVGAMALYQGYRYAKRRQFKETDEKLSHLSSEGFGNIGTGTDILEAVNEEKAAKSARRKSFLRRAMYKNSVTSKLLRGAGKVAKPLQIATDVTRVAHAYTADGNRIGRNTMVTAGNVLGAWLGIFVAGLLLTSALGALGLALGPIGFGLALVGSQAVGGMIGGYLGSAAGGGAYDGANFLGSTVQKLI